MNGSHRSEGVLILAGAGVAEGQQVDGASLLDIAPTLYWLLDVPAPAGTEGSVLSEAFVEGKDVQRAPSVVESVGGVKPYSEEEAAVVHKRLRGLGYRE